MEKYYVTVENDETRWYRDPKHTVSHRLDGPAITLAEGAQYWFEDGKQHNLDGPAGVHRDGRKEWFIRGIEFTEDQFNLVRALLNETDT